MFPWRIFTSEPQTRVSAAELLFRAPKSMTVGEQDFLATFASLAGDFLTDLDGRSKLPPAAMSGRRGPLLFRIVVLVSDDQHRAVGVAKDGMAVWSDDSGEVFGVVCPGDEQLDR